MDASCPLQQELSPPQLSSEGDQSGNARSTTGQLSSGTTIGKHDSDLAKCMQFREIDKIDILLKEARRQFVILMQSCTVGHFQRLFFINYSIKTGPLRRSLDVSQYCYIG